MVDVLWKEKSDYSQSYPSTLVGHTCWIHISLVDDSWQQIACMYFSVCLESMKANYHRKRVGSEIFWCSCTQSWLTIALNRAMSIFEHHGLRLGDRQTQDSYLATAPLELGSLSFTLRRSSLSFICAIAASTTINMTVKRSCTLIPGLRVSNRSTSDMISQALSFEERDMRSLCGSEKKDCSVLLANLWAGPMEAGISTCGISKLYRVAHF
jgi:hypothetical protein